jgi:hypothetical protein
MKPDIAPDGEHYIKTYPTGTYFNLADPQPEHVSVRDIAHSLSVEPRYAGHTAHPWTVGQHSIAVAATIAKLELDPTDELLLRALLHDSAEAYIKDVPGPAKRMPEFEGYRSVEHKIEKAIAERFQLPGLSNPLIKRADRLVLSLEQSLLRGTPPDSDESPHVRLGKMFKDEPQATVGEIVCALTLMEEREVEDAFLQRFATLAYPL